MFSEIVLWQLGWTYRLDYTGSRVAAGAGSGRTAFGWTAEGGCPYVAWAFYAMTGEGGVN